MPDMGNDNHPIGIQVPVRSVIMGRLPDVSNRPNAPVYLGQISLRNKRNISLSPCYRGRYPDRHAPTLR